MDFAWAINALKAGHKVTRKGWNGKGMFLWLMPATNVKAEWCKEPVLKRLAEDNGGEILCLGTIRMYTHDSTGRNAVLTGWLASQSDMLAEDWDYACVSPEDEQSSCCCSSGCAATVERQCRADAMLDDAKRRDAFLKELDKAAIDKLPKAGSMENCEKLSKAINQLLETVTSMPNFAVTVEQGPDDKQFTVTVTEKEG